jgi:hypothetical protein
LLKRFGRISAAKKSYSLFEFLKGQVELHRLDRRKAALLLQDDPDWRKAIQQDFQTSSAELKAVSAVYFLYFHPETRGLNLSSLAEAIPFSIRQYQRYLTRGYDWLAELMVLAEQDAQEKIQSKHMLSLNQFIPEPEYRRLFGVAHLAEKIRSALQIPLSSNGPQLISLEGLGGIGKTAIAREVAVGFKDEPALAGICWVSAKQEWINAQDGAIVLLKPDRTCHDILLRLAKQLGVEKVGEAERIKALQSAFSRDAYLVVIDNLETVEDHKTLLPILASIKGISRFLLTSRYNLSGYPYVQTIPVPELSLESSLELLRDELTRQAVGDIAADAMDEIYHLIGGMPLALKLTAAQLATIPYRTLLNGLRSADRRTPEALYSFVYRQTWHLLDDSARALLISMVDSSPDGETLDWLLLMGGLDEPVFEDALRQLQNFRLVDKTGLIDQPLYRIHRITSSFLHSNIRSRWNTV